MAPPHTNLHCLHIGQLTGSTPSHVVSKWVWGGLSMRILAILLWAGGRVERGDRSSPLIFMRTSKRIGTQDANGRFYNCIGWDRGGGHVGR